MDEVKRFVADMKRQKIADYTRLNRLARKGQTVLAGSSLCEQFPIHELLNTYPGKYCVYNRGINGDSSEGYLETLDCCVLELEPSKVFINIGTNDMNESYIEQRLMDTYRRILLRIIEKLPKVRIYILSYYPVNRELIFSGRSAAGDMDVAAVFGNRTNSVVDSANLRLRELATELGAEYIDVNTILRGDDGELIAEYSLDGIHLLPPAYKKVLSILINYM